MQTVLHPLGLQQAPSCSTHEFQHEVHQGPHCELLCLQVGCPMRCTFCATGKGGFARNLKPHEVVDQVMTVSELYQQRVSNVGKWQRVDNCG